MFYALIHWNQNLIRSIFNSVSWDLVIFVMKFLIWACFFFWDCVLFFNNFGSGNPMKIKCYKWILNIYFCFLSPRYYLGNLIWRRILNQILKYSCAKMCCARSLCGWGRRWWWLRSERRWWLYFEVYIYNLFLKNNYLLLFFL